MTPRLSGIVVLLLVTFSGPTRGQSCSRAEHQRCVALADPLLKDPHLIVPDSIKDIDMVCRTWSSFVDCIKRYIENCFSEQRKEQFNLAVEVPIASVHQMCSVSTYQAEYLRYASCIKATVTEAEHCGNQYAALVDEVSKGEVARTSLCCSHYHFRKCVIAESRKRCDGSQNDGAAARFSRQVLDKALSFLQDQCQNYIPNSGDCPIATTTDDSALLSVSQLGEGSDGFLGTRTRPYHRASTPDGYSGQASDIYNTDSRTARPSTFESTRRALDLTPTKEPRGSDARASSEDPLRNTANPNDNFIPGKVGGDMEDELVVAQVESTGVTGFVQNAQRPGMNDGVLARTPSDVIVTRRPSTYGRGMSWSSPATESTSEVPAWVTSTWSAPDRMPPTDRSWFPAAGSFGGNHIDEPNQQGLSKNGQTCVRSETIFIAIVSILLYAM